MDIGSRSAEDGPAGRLRVVIVAEASPARGGLATFADLVGSDPVLAASFEIRLLNTTRRATRRGGALSWANVRSAVADAARTFSAAKRADVVHIQTALLPTLPLMRAVGLCEAARLGGAAVLCHVHTGQANVGPYESYVPSVLQRLLLRRLRRTERILTVSDAGTAGLRPWVPGARIERVDNAVDSTLANRADPARTPPTIAYVGALGAAKGLKDLLAALVALRSRGVTGWRLTLIGGSNQLGTKEADAIAALYEEAGFGDAVVGAVDVRDVRRRLAEASLFVLPSHSEGQPIAILEAMAAGLPIVATAVGAVSDLVRDGRDGLVVPPRDPEALGAALESLIVSPELRSRLGASARTRAMHYDVSSLRTRLAALYREAAVRRP